MADITETKALARESAASARGAVHGGIGGAGEALMAAFLASDLLRAGDVVSAYWPIRSEIDPRPLIRHLHGLGHRICLPVIEARGQPLRFREWSPGCEMARGPFGAMVPAAGEWLEPTLLLVPLLTFDRRGFRLGYGGGFYDRTLERLRARGAVRAVGIAYAGQEVDEVPVEPTDQRLDAIVTEAGVILPSGEEVA